MNHHATCYLSPANSGNMNLPAVLMAAWQMITIGRLPSVLL